MTETLRLLTENTAKFAKGSVIKDKFYDLINRKNKHVETKSGDEIVADIVSRAGLNLS